MRQLASLLLIALALPATAADVWRWKDASGVVHYSDQPVPGAVRVNVAPAPAASDSSPTSTPQSPARAQQPAQESGYTRCVVTKPANDEVFHAVNAVDASLDISPALRSGHRMQVTLDGVAYPAWPSGVTSFRLNEIHRGTHTLSVQVFDANGASLCTGAATTFHVRQPSILSPARQPPAPAPVRPVPPPAPSPRP